MADSSLDTFLSFTNIFSDLVMLLVVLDAIALIAVFCLEKYDPRVLITWLIVLFFIPPAGFILYLYMGAVVYDRRKFKANTTPEEYDEVVRIQEETARQDMPNLSPGAREMVEVLENIEKCHYSNNNDIKLYTEGEPLINDIMADLAKARKHILIEYYIVRDDHDGNALMDLLIQKVNEGIEVRLLVDAFGIGKGPKKAIKRFKKAGGHYALFHSSWHLALSAKKNNRNHRKFIVVDGAVAYCGGFNIGDEYRGEGPLGHWRDATVRVVGNGIIPMLYRFSADWQYCTKKDSLSPVSYYYNSIVEGNHGDDRMQMVSGGPETMPDNAVQMQYLSMMVAAKKRLYITTPYLSPDDSMMVALSNAARSGVDVRILIPDKKDHIFLYWNNLTCANRLMRSGVRVFRYNDGFVHEKMILVDDDICSVGSANLDHRSMTLNFETNVMLYSERLTAQAAEQFLRDLEVSTEYTCEEYDNRSLMMRIRMAISWQMKLLA